MTAFCFDFEGDEAPDGEGDKAARLGYLSTAIAAGAGVEAGMEATL